MNNPYLLDQEYQDGQEMSTGLSVVYNAYERLPQVQDESMERVISFTHPYKTVADVIKAIDKNPNQADQALSKMAPQLRKDHNAMLELIGKSSKAYLYVHPSIDTKEFKQQALKLNPQVYNHLTLADKRSLEFNKAYLDGMTQTMKPVQIDPVTRSMQFKTQFHPDSLEHVFTPERYEQEYIKMLQNGAYMKPGYTLTTSWAYIATAEALAANKEGLAHMLDQYASIQHNALANCFNQNPTIGMCDRSLASAHNNLLMAIESKCPELQPEIQLRQRNYWESRRQDIDGICQKALDGQDLDQRDMRIFKEAIRHIELSKQQRTEMETKLKREQENIAYLRNDHIEDLYAKQIDGSAQSVTGAVSRVETIKTVGTHAQNFESLAYAQDWEQKYQDLVEPGAVKETTMQREDRVDKELEMDQRVAHREVIKESHENQDARDKEIEKEEIEKSQQPEEEPEYHPWWALAADEEEYEEEYHPWNETHTQDVVMTQKMTFK